jgi:hypothetical protein
MVGARCFVAVARDRSRGPRGVFLSLSAVAILAGWATDAAGQLARPVLADEGAKIAAEQPVVETAEPVCHHKSVDRPLSEVQARVAPAQGEVPSDDAAEVFGSSATSLRLADEPRHWPGTAFYWQASWLAHRPLCFEEKMLERYGYSHWPLAQPVISGAHFFATLPILPYKKGLDPHHQPIYDLGFPRPGVCAPALCPRAPWNARAAAYEAGAVTGLIFFIP